MEKDVPANIHSAQVSQPIQSKKKGNVQTTDQSLNLMYLLTCNTFYLYYI